MIIPLFAVSQSICRSELSIRVGLTGYVQRNVELNSVKTCFLTRVAVFAAVHHRRILLPYGLSNSAEESFSVERYFEHAPFSAF